MASITLGGNKIHTNGQLPAVGTQAPDFNFTKIDLSNTSLKDYQGKKLVLNIFPSVDTPTCAASVRHFNKSANELNNTVVLCVSKDLPFAQKRFCAAEGLENVVSASDFKSNDFSDTYGVRFIDGPLAGLLSRAVVIIDEKGHIIYTEQVDEIGHEPNYENVISNLK